MTWTGPMLGSDAMNTGREVGPLLTDLHTIFKICAFMLITVLNHIQILLITFILIDRLVCSFRKLSIIIFAVNIPSKTLQMKFHSTMEQALQRWTSFWLDLKFVPLKLHLQPSYSGCEFHLVCVVETLKKYLKIQQSSC